MGGDHARPRPAGRGGRVEVLGVIPAGGAGTRLWPRSRRGTPKQALPLGPGGESLIRGAYRRLQPLCERIFVLTEAAQVDQIRELLPDLGPDAFIVEPEPRGTASALGLAAMTLAQRFPESVLVVTAADQVVAGEAEFDRAVRLAAKVAAEREDLVTVGLLPRFPATGYGYICAGEEVAPGVFRVQAFVEKPPVERARQFLAEGCYYWNLSLFCWRADAFLRELGVTSPDHFQALQEAVQARDDGGEAAARSAYAQLPQTAVDYAVLERTRRLLLVTAEFEWTDVGSWAEVYAQVPHDQAGNAVDGETVLLDTEGSLISVPDKLVAAVGVRDLVVVGDGDALLVCPRERAQDVRKVIEELRRTGRIKYL